MTISTGESIAQRALARHLLGVETTSPGLVIREDSESFVWVCLIKARSRRALNRMVKERNWRKDTGCGADCTGLVFKASCEMLRAYRAGNDHIGVVVCSEYRDV